MVPFSPEKYDPLSWPTPFKIVSSVAPKKIGAFTPILPIFKIAYCSPNPGYSFKCPSIKAFSSNVDETFSLWIFDLLSSCLLLVLFWFLVCSSFTTWLLFFSLDSTISFCIIFSFCSVLFSIIVFCSSAISLILFSILFSFLLLIWIKIRKIIIINVITI